MTKLQYSITIDCLQGYMLHRKEYNDHVGQSWFSIIAKDIDEYVMTDYYFNYITDISITLIKVLKPLATYITFKMIQM